ncbi:MAG: ABC transporter permease [Acidimicrobiia bacterium]|nr:ABC transporter permease [Acidimicrobiia bacterium]MDH4307119.1 ABC transporter permease [Acidimicrobiia bacterium]
MKAWFANPWGKPRWLRVITIAYLVWSLLPVLIAVQFSFNAGRSRSTWQGFSLRWYLDDPASVARDDSLILALQQSLRLAALTMLVATPIGVALAIGLARWRGRGARPAGFLMLVPLVTPEIVMGVALFLVFANLYDFVPFGTGTQLLGHVTFAISFVVIIVRGRLFAIGRDYEEAAMDLGASPWESLRRVLLPLLAPAIFSSFAIVFAISIDDFVISQFLAGGASSITIPVRLYSGARVAPPPSLNALASLLLLATLSAVTIAALILRKFGRQEGSGDSAAAALTRIEI